MVGLIGGLGLQWQASFAIITLLYFYSHYLFASGAAHIGAMYTAFLSVSIAMGTPPLVVSFMDNQSYGIEMRRSVELLKYCVCLVCQGCVHCRGHAAPRGKFSAVFFCSVMLY